MAEVTMVFERVEVLAIKELRLSFYKRQFWKAFVSIPKQIGQWISSDVMTV